MSRQLWKPVTESDGIPYEVALHFSTAFSEWREAYLSIVGVPSNFEGEWDFVTVGIFQLRFLFTDFVFRQYHHAQVMLHTT